MEQTILWGKLMAREELRKKEIGMEDKCVSTLWIGWGEEKRQHQQDDLLSLLLLFPVPLRRPGEDVQHRRHVLHGGGRQPRQPLPAVRPGHVQIHLVCQPR